MIQYLDLKKAQQKFKTMFYSCCTATLKTQDTPEQVPCEPLIASEGVCSKVYVVSICYSQQ